MYSGTTLTPLSGRVLGAHQKLDKLARANLRYMLADNNVFPKTRAILHFEGVKGPDAIKRKSPAKDEPWHYFDPFDETDTRLIELIEVHYKELVEALKKHDDVRASFEAAWLAHAVVDGLTPAHHYPYEEELVELRGGAGIETRTTIREKLVMPGESRRHQLKNNWKMWGPKGLLTTHGLFEWGVAAVIMPMQHRPMRLSEHDLKELHKYGVVELFRRKAKEVAALGMYEQYYKTGWTPKLAKLVRKKLVPTIVQMLTLAWYSAVADAGLEKKTKA